MHIYTIIMVMIYLKLRKILDGRIDGRGYSYIPPQTFLAAV